MPDPVVKRIKAFREEAERILGAPVARIVLFGSRARDSATQDSDTDLIVVSRAFEGMSFIRRGALLRKAWPRHEAVDLICLTPAEFEQMRTRPTLVRRALAEGIDIQP